MDRLCQGILKKRRLIIIVVVVLTLLGVVGWLNLKIDYNLQDYLPEDANSTEALELMQEEFGGELPNMNVMVTDVTLMEAVAYKAQLAEVDNVVDVMWLDDVLDLSVPLETQDTSTVEAYYKDGNALFSVTAGDTHEKQVMNDIRELLGDKGYLSGSGVDEAYQQIEAVKQTLRAILIIVPLLILILVLTTQTWIDFLLFLISLAVPIIINLGTSIFFGEMCYITFSVAPILQLAVSLDYAVFLSNSFDRFSQTESDPFVAMGKAMRESLNSIAASAATTFFGFFALVFMDFGVGMDLGMGLVKGILLSFLSATIFLPALMMCCQKWRVRFWHKRLLPDFAGVGGVLKARVPIFLIVVLAAAPCYLAQKNNTFTYGNVSFNAEEVAVVEETFGYSNPLVLIVPEGEPGTELALAQELEELDAVGSVVSYATSVGTTIPAAALDTSITEQFYSGDYARLILYTEVPKEGEEAFALVEQVRTVAGEYYAADEVYLCGESANIYDMKLTVEHDNIVVNAITLGTIFIVLLIALRSILLPFLLIFCIKVSIWINMAIPFILGLDLNYIGYLVVNAVQMGATIDYAILMTNKYLAWRQRMAALPAMKGAMGETFKAILVSGLSLAGAGAALALASNEEVVRTMGILICRGALIPLCLVIVFLPALLLLFDRLIPYTTLRTHFWREGDLERE